MGRLHDLEVSAWIKGISSSTLSKRMQRLGLIGSDVGLLEVSIKDFMERFFATLTCKQSARTFYGHTRRCLETFLGAGKHMRSVKMADADAWKAWLVSNEKLAPATVSRRIIAARTMWKKALRWKLVAESPFAGIRAGNQQNESRKFFLKPEVIDALIDVTPDVEWKVLIALSRYGGLVAHLSTWPCSGRMWTGSGTACM